MLDSEKSPRPGHANCDVEGSGQDSPSTCCDLDSDECKSESE